MNKEELNKELKAIELAKKDVNAFGYLYERYFKQIFLFILKRVSNKDLAGDLTSQVFLKALENLDKYEYRGFPFSSWLYRISINEVNQHYRKSSKHTEVEITENELGVILIDAEIEKIGEQFELLIEILNELSPEMTQLIDLRFFEKQSFREIGEIFGITEDNAKVKLYRVLRKMKKMVTLKLGKGK
ncbi:MAG: sigma-70 family RNA polymerase sigma factor [Flavobacteriales bacterium]|nr:sigma-70 family RNA polymerase sigma factor [Flavobacteriales bacterium]